MGPSGAAFHLGSFFFAAIIVLSVAGVVTVVSVHSIRFARDSSYRALVRASGFTTWAARRRVVRDAAIVPRLRDVQGRSRFATLVAVRSGFLTVRRDDATIDCIGPRDVVEVRHPDTVRNVSD